MFAPFSSSSRPADTGANDSAFVETLSVVHPREPRSRRSEIVLGVCWVLIIAKCAAVWWICETHPQVKDKLDAWWVIGPTLAFASLCTWLYWRRD